MQHLSEQCQKKLSEQVCFKAIHELPTPEHGECKKNFYPVRELLDLVGDKWSVLIILNLGERGKLRFSELAHHVEGISKRMLSLKLQNLERDGMLVREVIDHYPPRVEYGLTEMGQSLLFPIKGLAFWAVQNYSQVEASRKAFLERQETQERAPWLHEKDHL